ncbi:hypothetical protein [Methylophaga thiooxydans]|uniref:hypothetical protein n=1 Tax=Methylophaga thiooxydans TaxID=392484 RepID=UPI00235621D0|nr:hypothetical protein [Methylophaga thiooxydans]
MSLLLITIFSLIAEQSVSFLGWCLNILPVLSFFMLVNRIMNPDRKAFYEEESLIPLNDDTPEERELFQTEQVKSKHSYHLDA